MTPIADANDWRLRVYCVEKLSGLAAFLSLGFKQQSLGLVNFTGWRLCLPFLRVLASQYCSYVTANTGLGGKGHSRLAIRLRFCAVAASRNSSWAPLRPRNRNRSSFKIRLRCANRTSTFFRSLRDCL